MAGNLLDTFFYSLRLKDEGVAPKLSEVEKRLKATESATKEVSKNFGELGSQLRSSLDQVLPGSEKVIAALGKIGNAVRSARMAGVPTPSESRINLPGKPRPPGTPVVPGGAVPPVPPVPGAGGGVGGAASAAGGLALGASATVAAVGLAGLAVAAAMLTKAFLDGSSSLIESRKAATAVGVNNTQMAANEQYAKSMGFDKQVARDTLKEISEKTQAGWVKSREFGNIFGIGNETTQMLKKKGIRTSDEKGELRNSSAIFEDIAKKMKGMSRDSAIAFGEFFGMTKDFAAGVYDNKQSLSQFTTANKESIAAQAEAMAASKNYERAQQRLKNAWDDFAIQVGGELIPVITDVFNWINKSIPTVKEFGMAVYGNILMIKDTAVQVFDFLMNSRRKLIDGLMGAGVTDALDEAFGLLGDKAVKTAGDVMTTFADYARKQQKPVDTSKVDKEMKENTSMNAKSAKVQLEAANLMKTATAKFGLSLEEYMAMWAAETGKGGGLRDSGGMGTSNFRDAYRSTVQEYARPEVAIAMYGRGQPMMQQMPAQYAMGLGVTPMGIPAHAKGLSRAQSAVRDTSAPVGPAAAPFGGASTRMPGKGKGDTNVQIDKIEINTQSTDPEEINRAVGRGLADQMRMAVNTNNDGRLG